MGTLHKGWTEVALGDLITVAPTVRAGNSQLPLLSMTMRNGLVDQHDKFKKRVASADTSDYRVAARGQLVVGFPIDEAVLSFQRIHDAGIVSPAYTIWDLVDEAIVHRLYLERFLRSPTAIRYYVSKLRGTTARRRSLPRPQFEAMPIPLPPIEEQRRIAAVLDQADELRAKRRATLALVDTLTESIFLDMFGDPVSNPRQWPTVTLQQLGSLERGVSRHRPRNDPALLGGTHPLIQTGDVARSGGYITEYASTYSDLGLAQSKLWPAGTLCITIAANIALTGILTFDACFPDSVVGFSSDPATTEYVRALLRFHQKRLEAAAPESAQKNINLAVLRDLEVPGAPTEFLIDFHAAQRVARDQARHVAAHLDQLDNLFASLQQRAFQGDL